MFFGTHTLRMDEKGRVALPARFRERLVDGLVVVKSQDACLAVYPKVDFEGIGNALRAVPATGRKVRGYQRMLYGSADDPIPDKQGRVVITRDLRRYAGLEQDCVAVGANDHFEIWASGAWESFLAENEPEFAAMEEGVVPGVL
ncbi:MAG: division/cell wall cluster transcriptional repressor MraZ [Geodermatophilaceae bacterium]